MRKELNFKKLLSAAAAALALLLAGCSSGSTVDTELTINDDLSGVRVMDVTINSSSFSSNFNGNIDDLNAAISDTCPDALSWEYYVDENGNDCYRVELSFSSPTDYKDKIESITGEEEEIVLSSPDTVWASGFMVSESVSSTQLLSWMEDVLAERGLVSESQKSSVFSGGSSVVIYGGSEYSTPNQISINQLEYLPLQSIEIRTAVESLDTYSRNVMFYIPGSSMNAKGDDIKKFMEGNIPDGASSEWGTYDGGTTLSVTGERMTAGGLDAFTRTIFADDANTVQVTDSSEQSDIFTVSRDWNETLNLTSYAGNKSGTVNTVYYISIPDGLEADGIVSGGSETEDGYSRLFESSISARDISFTLNRRYLFAAVEVETRMEGADDFSRTSTFTFVDTLPDDLSASILAELTGRLDEAESDAGITLEPGSEGHVLTVSQSGSSDKLNSESLAIFGSGVSIHNAIRSEISAVKDQFAFAESFRYGDFIGEKPEGYSFKYTFDAGSMAKIDENGLSTADLSGNEIDYELSGSSLVAESSSATGIDVILSGTRINLVAVIIWIAMAVVLVLLVLGIIKTGVISMVKKDLADRKAARAAALTETAVPATSVETARIQPATVRFCPECGTENKSNGRFCENCGCSLVVRTDSGDSSEG